jgi:hypothetical protein
MTLVTNVAYIVARTMPYAIAVVFLFIMLSKRVLLSHDPTKFSQLQMRYQTEASEI